MQESEGGAVITQDRIKGSLGIGTGLLTNVAGYTAAILRAPSPVLIGTAIVALTLTGYGCIYYARAKGYSPFLGVPGLLPPPLGYVGLVIVCLLPDRMPEEQPGDIQRKAHQDLRDKNRERR